MATYWALGTGSTGTLVLRALMDTMVTLAPLLAAQYSQAAGTQLAEAGVTRKQVRRMIDTGKWTNPYRGVIRLVGSVPCPEQDLLAVCLAHGPDAVICERSACWLWEMPGQHPWGPPIHVLCPGNDKVRLPGVQTHRSRLLVPADVTTRRGVPVVSYARALIDSTGRGDLSDRDLGFMADHGVRWKHMTSEDLVHTAARLEIPAHGRSPRRMRLIVAGRAVEYNPGASQPELRTAGWVRAAGFGEPVLGAKVRVNGVTWEVDIALIRLKIGWEYQSKLFHGEESVEARKRDAEKRAALEDAGWLIGEAFPDDTEATFISRASVLVAKRLSAQ